MTYTRAQLRDALATRFKLERKVAADIVEEVLVQIAEQVMLGHKVELRGFGIFEPYTRKQKIVRNPRKPQVEFILPERKTIKFRIGKVLDEVLNQPAQEVQESASS